MRILRHLSQLNQTWRSRCSAIKEIKGGGADFIRLKWRGGDNASRRRGGDQGAWTLIRFSTADSKRFRENQFFKKQIMNFVQGCALERRGKMSDSWVIHNKVDKDRHGENKRQAKERARVRLHCIWSLQVYFHFYPFFLPRIPCDFIPLNHTEPH